MRVFFIIVVNIIFWTLPAIAQEDEYIGAYNGSKHELVLQLYILPENDFVITMSYGAVDRLVVGKWKEEGAAIVLQEDRSGLDEPFFVYQAKREIVDKRYTFQHFDWNTTTAFGTMDSFDPARLMYIHRPDEFHFSHENNLSLKDTSNTFFISRAQENTIQEVYAYESGEGYNSIYLFYNQAIDDERFESRAILKDQTLYWLNDSGGTERVGVRDALPEGYQQMVKEVSDYKTVPDTITRIENDVEVSYYRLAPKQVFESQVDLDASKAYFFSDNDQMIAPPKLPSNH